MSIYILNKRDLRPDLSGISHKVACSACHNTTTTLVVWSESLHRRFWICEDCMCKECLTGKQVEVQYE